MLYKIEKERPFILVYSLKRRHEPINFKLSLFLLFSGLANLIFNLKAL
jgi:hypothetical protein